MSSTPPIKPIAADFAVAGQLSPADVPAIAAQGFATLINNRPDGEGGPAQPRHADIEAAARAAGLHYVYLPVTSGHYPPEMVRALQQALRDAPRPILAFCRSGARSAQFYGLALQTLQG
jgi:uncharacterized protein (TIGR01244 family)